MLDLVAPLKLKKLVPSSLAGWKEQNLLSSTTNKKALIINGLGISTSLSSVVFGPLNYPL